MEEKETKKQEKSNKNKGLVAIVVILLLVIVGLVIYICYDKGIISNSRKEETTEKKETKKQDTKKQSEKEVTKDEIKALDLTKSLNTVNYVYENPTVATTSCGLTVKVNSDKKTVTLTIDWKTFGPLTSASAYSNESQDYVVKGFDKNVKAAYVGEFGQSPVTTTLLFIMEDGTVSYMPMFVQVKDQAGYTRYDVNYTYDKDASGKVTDTYFKVKGYSSDAKDVVEIYNVDEHQVNSTGARTAIAATKDGSFYDLTSIINN